jgi:hypothetical protein
MKNADNNEMTQTAKRSLADAIASALQFFTGAVTRALRSSERVIGAVSA